MTERRATVAANLHREDDQLSNSVGPLLDYIQLFGLTQPPFEKGLGGFFSAHGRQSLLAQLIHLLHFSDNVTTLIGAPGVGKSTLLQEIYTQLSGEDYVYFRAGVEMGSASQLLFSLAKTIGLAVSEQDSELRLRARLNEWSEFSGGSLQVYILIDDAELLAPQTLEVLLDLVSPDETGTCWHLLLVGAPVLADRVSAAQPAEAEPTQTFSMPEVTQEFVADYLAYRLEDAGFDRINPFAESDEESIWLTANGDLNRVNAMAEIHLLEKAATPESRAATIPWLHLSALTALGLLLAIAWWGYEDEPTSVTLSVPLAEQRSSVETLSSAPLAGEDSAVPELAAGQMTPNTEITPQDITAQADPLMVSGGFVKPEPVVPVQAEPQLIDPAPKPIVAKAPVSVPTKPAFAGDEAMLLALPASHYTLQVLAAESKVGVERFIEANGSEPLRWYTTKRSGKPWYVVVLGVYESADQARRATQRLPKKLQKAGPWPRTLASVQQQINEN